MVSYRDQTHGSINNRLGNSIKLGEYLPVLADIVPVESNRDRALYRLCKIFARFQRCQHHYRFCYSRPPDAFGLAAQSFENEKIGAYCDVRGRLPVCSYRPLY